MIALREIKKSFGAKIILDIPLFDFQEGIYWIKGEIGSGKTTLLKIISGVIPYKGDVLIDGISQKYHPVGYRKLISYAEAEPLYPGFLSGREMLDFYSGIKKEKEETIQELLEILKVNYYIKTAIGTYSSGMVKKLSLLLAFTGKPKIILLDEPLITLDSDSIPHVYELIKKYHEKYGTCFFLTSHQEFRHAGDLVTQKLLVENQTIRIIA